MLMISAVEGIPIKQQRFNAIKKMTPGMLVY
jgi:hypothetical protein